jgi:hypothetical protein
MEQQILALIEEEVSRRVSLAIVQQFEQMSRLYDIPMECTFCKGLLKSNKRCMKQPKENGYCGFHQKQIPQPTSRVVERVKAPWET